MIHLDCGDTGLWCRFNHVANST